MLIADAELEGGARADVRLAGGRIAAVGRLAPRLGERVVRADGALLLPGLHDHHIHALALAAAMASIPCGPPAVTGPAQLAAALRAAPGGGWLRGTGYHESVAGLPDAAALDALVADRPVRIQHRSGRMWLLNGRALAALLAVAPAPPGLERVGGRFTGRLFDEDAWLRRALGGRPPGLAGVGRVLAARGVTGLTDMSPANDGAVAAHVGAEQAAGALPQSVLLAGAPALAAGDCGGRVALGPVKLHLHEAALPELDAAAAIVARAHAAGRPIAVHCATEVELMFALAAIGDAGAMPGDRIEHASVTPDHAADALARLGLGVATQPAFVAERGDQYLAAVPPRDVPLLYRQRAFLDRGVALAGSSDAPYTAPDPWAAMTAAVTRTAPSGAVIGAGEALAPEEALGLYLAHPERLGERRRVMPGAPADLCLLDRAWAAARGDLAAVGVAATWCAGVLVHGGAGLR